MRLSAVLLASAAFVGGASAHAADTLRFGPAPSWVVAQTIPTTATKAANAPAAVLLSDDQVRLEPGKTTTYEEIAIKLQAPEGLTGGNIAFPWNPAFDTVTVNKLHIIRGGKVVDVLASGQSFTTARRETNLDAATLDGTLTAALQPEDLQVGDIVDFAMTDEHVDPVLKNHAEDSFALWNQLPIELAHARLSWAPTTKITTRETELLPAAHQSLEAGNNVLEITGKALEPPIPPKSAPERFQVGRWGEASDFTSWDQVSQLMLPLYRQAAVIPPSGALHDEVEKIREASKDPKIRAEQALALVEDRVRYVALEMGTGGYVPASAETTWSRRFGDCKAKSVLLLAILQSLGIAAEPVLVQANAGDMIADRLPMVALFNHAIVRAHVGGKIYWLDGTRTGDTGLEGIHVPNFGWVLPLTENASLVHLIPPPLDKPSRERLVDVDASAGIFAPAAVSISEIYRGDTAVAFNILYSSLTGDQRDQALHDEAKGFFDTFAVTSSSVQFDRAKRELTLAIKGTAKLNWKDGWFDVPTSSIAFDPDFDRPAGALHDVPLAIGYPSFVRDVASIRLPAGLAAQEKLSPPIHETLAGVEYARTEAVNGDTLTVESSERSLAPEVSYKDAIAAETQLRNLYREDVYLREPGDYHASASDLSVIAKNAPTSADDYVQRGAVYLHVGRFDEVIADTTEALKLDPENKQAVAERAFAFAAKHQFQAAETDAESAQKTDPDNPLLLDTRALVSESKGDFKDAADFYSKALAQNPDDEYTQARLGMVLVDLSRDQDALPYLNRAISSNPKDALALVNRAMAEANLGNLNASETDAHSALDALPDYPAALMVLARIAEKRGNHQAVLQAYSAEIESGKAFMAKNGISNPSALGSALLARARIYSQLGRSQEAVADTEAALTIGYKSPELRLFRANIFMKEGNHEGVAKEADLLVQENPTSDFAYVAAAKSYAALGQHEKAMQLFNQALAIKPTALIYLNRSAVRPPSDMAGKLADLDEALKLEPDNADALAFKADVLSKTGKYTEALALFDRVPKPAGSETGIETQHAILLYKAGQKAEAEKEFANLHAKAKTPADLNNLCWEEGTSDILLDAAVTECRQAVKLSNGNAQFVDSLGMALLKSGKLDEALATYNEAIEKGHYAASYMARAIIYARKGDAPRAQADFAEAKKLEPGIEDRFAEYGLKFDEAPAENSQTAAKPASTNPATTNKVTVVSVTPE